MNCSIERQERGDAVVRRAYGHGRCKLQLRKNVASRCRLNAQRQEASAYGRPESRVLARASSC
jgi:hypothetical protein